MNEVWKPYPKNNKYLVSNLGKVQGIHGKILKGRNVHGYIQICLKGNGDTYKYVHRMVAETFLPEYDENLTIDHINGIRDDNRLENLRVVSIQDNIEFKSINQHNIFNLLQNLIQLKGYEYVTELLQKEIKGEG